MEKEALVVADITVGGVLTFVSSLFGGWSFALETLVIFMTFDYATGVLKALYKKELSSEAGLKGIIRKIGYMIILAIAYRLDQIAGDTGALYTLVVYFFVANEGISIIENWASMDLPMPKILRETLIQLRDSSGKSKTKKPKKKV